MDETEKALIDLGGIDGCSFQDTVATRLFNFYFFLLPGYRRYATFG